MSYGLTPEQLAEMQQRDNEAFDRNLARAERWIQMLRRNGASKFQGFGFDMLVELHPAGPILDTSPDMPAPKALQDLTGAGMCHCGHDMTAHGGHGLCLMGCNGEECAKGEVKAPTP